MADPRPRRLAENENRFREINERLEGDLRSVPDNGEPVGFVCECARARCSAVVRLTIAEYEGVRQDARHFVLIPGHEISDVEDVVRATDRFVVVRKRPETAPIVEAADPRRGG